MVKSYEEVKFFLFANSYSGQKISIYLKGRFKGKKLTKAIKRLSVVLDFKYNQVTNFIMFDLKPISPYQKRPAFLKIYLEVEKELAKLSEEKLDEYSTALEDYQRQLLYPAIERASGNSLTDTKNDRKFAEKLEDKIRIYTNTYYKVAYKDKKVLNGTLSQHTHPPK